MSWSGGDAVGADPTQHAVIWVAQTQIDRRSAKSAEEMHRGATPSCGESRNCAPADTSKPTTPYCSLFPPPRPHTFCIGFDALVDRPKGGLACGLPGDFPGAHSDAFCCSWRCAGPRYGRSAELRAGTGV